MNIIEQMEQERNKRGLSVEEMANKMRVMGWRYKSWIATVGLSEEKDDLTDNIEARLKAFVVYGDETKRKCAVCNGTGRVEG